MENAIPNKSSLTHDPAGPAEAGTRSLFWVVVSETGRTASGYKLFLLEAEFF